jgi:GNAT superfamily N-acetyltransferase
MPGGLIGFTHWNWLYITNFWLAEKARGVGSGSKVLLRAEQVARERGCNRSHLTTYGFQALAFFERHGY